MKVKKLYGIIDKETLELYPMQTCHGYRYAYTKAVTCLNHLPKSDKYQIIELIPNKESF